MNRKGESNPMTLLVFALLIVVIGVVFITIVADTASLQTKKQVTTNQSIPVTTAYIDSNNVNTSINYTIYSQSNWKKTECPLTSVAIRNGAGTSLTANTDYILYANEGVFSLKNTTKTVPSTSLNLTYVDDTHCSDGYLTSSADRSLANLWTTFMILALIAILAGVAFKLIKEKKF